MNVYLTHVSMATAQTKLMVTYVPAIPDIQAATVIVVSKYTVELV